jgi:hypothetical protein
MGATIGELVASLLSKAEVSAHAERERMPVRTGSH